jgi:hypothetical protein
MTRPGRPLVEQWLDLAVYAPIGVVTLLSEELPVVVRRGRERAEQRVQVARFFGQMAVAYGQAEMKKRRQAAAAPTADVPTATDPMPDPVDAPVGDAVAESVGEPVAAPFDGYDTMPAVHVVERLRRMTPDELRAVRAYEAGQRARRTVLGKIDQLLA